MFLREHARRQGLGGVAGQDGHHGLVQVFPVVEFGGHTVYRAACELAAGIDGALVRVLSWYDNEWGFSNRMLDTAAVLGRLG